MTGRPKGGQRSRPLVLPGNVDPHRFGTADSGDAPRLDYVETARRLSAELPDLEGRLPPRSLYDRFPQVTYAARALEVRRRRPTVVLSLSEKVGMAVGMTAPRGLPHVVVAHNVTTARRKAFQRRTHWLDRLDRVVVQCNSQAAYLRDEAGLDPARVRFIRGSVDHRYFRPLNGEGDGYVVSVGRDRRDYPSLIEAVGALKVRTIIVASTRWCVNEKARDGGGLPSNVELRAGLTDAELRALYDRASVVAVPLHAGVDSAAGVTGVLEGMAMAKPVVVSATPGIADYVRGGETAEVVAAGDPGALSTAIERLLTDHAHAGRMGSAGRHFIETGCNLDLYVDDLVAVVAEVGPAH